jgi:spermidine synthase
MLVSGLAAAGAAAYAPRVPLLVAEAVASPDANFSTIVRLQSGLIAVLMLPMTVAFGSAFPLAVALAALEDEMVSRDVANVYTANTLGAIAGALGGGFLLVPWLGLQNTVRAASLLAIAGFTVVAITHTRRGTGAAAAIGAAVAATAAVLWLPPWDREILSSGAYKYAPYLQSEHREALLRAGSLLYYREGAAATVSVREVTGSRSLAIDGKVDASNSGDMLTQRLLAHVPLLLHPNPKHVGIIGLGSGVTLGSALRHPVERVDMLEISREVVEASQFFARENHAALSDPRTRLVVGDGRSHLALGRNTYDVIISEPSNPWMAGVAALFTREFFEAARARLTPQGVLCQWAHTYDISEDDLRSIVATFASVFPNATLWLVGEGDLLLIGSPAPIEPRLVDMRKAWNRPGVATDLTDVDVRSPDTLLTLFTAGGARLRSYAADAPIQTDDGMSLEFSAPRGIYGRTTVDNAATLRRLADGATLPAVVRDARNATSAWADRGAMHLRAEAYRVAYDDLNRAVQRNPNDAEVVEGLLRAAAAANRLPDAESLLQQMARQQPNVAAAVGVSKVMAARGDYSAATEPLRPFLTSGVPDVRALEQLASIFADSGDASLLEAVVADLQRVAPDSEPALYYAASARFMSNRPADAVAIAERLRDKNGRHARGLNLLGAAYAALGRSADAREAFEASVIADPHDATAYANLGTFELQAGDARAASDYFAQALTLDPNSTAAQQGLADALSALGRH